MQDQSSQINNAIQIIDEILYLLSQAKQKFKKARNWGFVDLFGGGFFTNLMKHSNLNSASNEMKRVSDLLEELKQEFSTNDFSSDYEVQISGFATFADFFFDGIFADSYVQGKIVQSIEDICNLENRIQNFRRSLLQTQ